MKDEVADAVRGGIGTPPELLLGERFGAGAQAGPVVLEELAVGELKEELSDLGIGVCHGWIRLPRIRSLGKQAHQYFLVRAILQGLKPTFFYWFYWHN